MKKNSRRIVRDGVFSFVVKTDNENYVSAELVIPDESCCYPDIRFTAVRRGDDVFDFHKGLHIVIRKCLRQYRSSMVNFTKKLLRKVESRISESKYYDIEKFEENRKKYLAKMERRRERNLAETGGA